MFKRLLVIFVVLMLSGCRWWGAETSKFSGTVEMDEHSLGTAAGGRLAEVTVEEGDPVKKGDTIATLEHYEQAKKDHQRLKEIFDAGGVDAQSVEHAFLAMEDQRVTAPLDGTVLLKVRESGEVVSAGSPVVVLGEAQKPWVRVFVPEGVVNRVRLGQEASVRLDGIKKGFKGRVSYIAPKAEFTPRNVQTAEERVTQTFAVKIMIEGADTAFKSGVYADVTLGLGEK